MDMAGYSGDARPAHRADTVEELAHRESSTRTLETRPPVSLTGGVQGFEVTLPIPPSTNNLFKNVRRGRAKSGDYRDWIALAGWNLRQLQIAPVRGRYELSITVAEAMRGDISNRIKAVEDLFVALKLTDDDRRCGTLHVYRSDEQRTGTCRVSVMPLPIKSSSAALTGVGGGPRPRPVHPPAGRG